MNKEKFLERMLMDVFMSLFISGVISIIVIELMSR